jgi:hypothetical protein
VTAINVGRTSTDIRLIEVLGATMATVFPNVYVLDVPDYGSTLGNSLVIATKQPTQIDNFAFNVTRLQDPHLRIVANRSLGTRIWEFQPAEDELIFTDDKAPVEQVIHGLIARYLLGG